MNATCGTCGVALVESAVLYDERGNVTCQRCLLASQALDSQKQVSRKVKGIAYGGPVLGLAALVFNPAWLLSIAAVANGLYVLRSVREPDTAKHLQGSLEKIRMAAIAGMVLGAIAGALRALTLVAR